MEWMKLNVRGRDVYFSVDEDDSLVQLKDLPAMNTNKFQVNVFSLIYAAEYESTEGIY